MKKVFIEGAISPEFIAESIAKHQSKKSIGAHEIFLGQVRADELNSQVVKSIEYTCYKEMAEEKVHDIRERTFDKFDLSCMHIYHSLGKIDAGEICFFVFTSSAHRKQARMATSFVVDEIKKEVPIFGKEIFENDSFKWKTNI